MEIKRFCRSFDISIHNRLFNLVQIWPNISFYFLLYRVGYIPTYMHLIHFGSIVCVLDYALFR